MQFKAERRQTDRRETLLNDLQCCHLFGHKQDRLSLGKYVCNESRDGLRFAGPRGPVKHEAFSLGGRFNGKQLRSVCGDGQKNFVLRDRPVDVHIFRLPGQMTLHQAANHLTSCKIVCAVVDIIPHNELREGEDAKACGFQHVPTILIHDRMTDRCIDAPGIDAFVILRERIQTVDFDTEILTQLLQQRDVHLDFIVTQSDYIAFSSTFANHFYRNQQQGSIACLRASIGLIPFQQTEREVQCVRAVFLHIGLCRTIQAFQRVIQFCFCKSGTKSTAFEFRLEQGGITLHKMEALKADFSVNRHPVCRARTDREVSAVSQRVFQIIQRRGKERDHGLGKAQVQQSVAHTEIEQFSLPQSLLRKLLLVILRNNDWHRNMLRSVGQLIFPGVGPFHAPAVRGLDSGRQRRNVAEPGTANVNKAFYGILALQFVFSGPASIIESGVLSGC